MSESAPDYPTEIQTYELVFPEHANPSGAAFGGHVLGLMDKVGWYASTRAAKCAMVTIAVEKVEFKVPIRVGDLLERRGCILRVGRSSILVLVEVLRTKFGSHDQAILATTGQLTFVAVDERGNPTAHGLKPYTAPDY